MAVIAGPRKGLDSAAIRISGDKVLVVTTDPISYIPKLGAGDSAWLSVNLIASDLTTSGFSPQYAVFTLNLPPKMRDMELEEYWKAVHNECRKLGVAIVGGHTGRYSGCDYTVVGSGTMFAAGPRKAYLNASMARDGDDLIVTKGVAVETTAVLTRAFPRTVRRALGEGGFETAWASLRKVTVVPDALAAKSVGVKSNGVTAMHDATEGGVRSGIIDLTEASGLGAEIDLEAIPVSPETDAICKLFRIDSLSSLSEGTLLISSRPHRTGRVIHALKSRRIRAAVVGRLTSRNAQVWASRRGKRRRLRYPAYDPYWKAYLNGIRRNWK